MTPENTQSLSVGEVLGLVRHWQLAVRPESPFCRLPESDASRPPAEFAENEHWRRVFAVLAAPEHYARAITPAAGGPRIANYYAQPSGELKGFVGCWGEGGRVHISAPLTPRALLEATAPPGVQAADLLPDPESIRLTPSGLMALMAAADALRDIHLTAVQERTIQPDLRLDAELLQKQIVRGHLFHDPNWAVTALRMMTGGEELPEDGLLEMGLPELVSAGWLTAQSGGCQPAQPLQRFARGLQSSMSTALHEAAAFRGGQVEDYRCAITICGSGPLWVIDYPRLTGTDSTGLLRSIEPQDYLETIAATLTIPGLAPSPASPISPPLPGIPSPIAAAPSLQTAPLSAPAEASSPALSAPAPMRPWLWIGAALAGAACTVAILFAFGFLKSGGTAGNGVDSAGAASAQAAPTSAPLDQAPPASPPVPVRRQTAPISFVDDSPVAPPQNSANPESSSTAYIPPSPEKANRAERTAPTHPTDDPGLQPGEVVDPFRDPVINLPPPEDPRVRRRY